MHRRFVFMAVAAFIIIPWAYAYTEVTVMAPAVAKTSEGWVGVPSYVNVWIEPGDGRVFVDTFPLTEIDTQGSVRLAAEAAASLIGEDLSKLDLYVVIRSDSAVIGGPSAGGVLSVAILASLLNRTVDPSVIMTGTINPDGTIGPIGGVLQKAEAAHSVGARNFLIPRGQSIATESPSSTKTVNVAEYALTNWNLTVMEVDDLREAAKWMIGVEIKPAGGGEEIDLAKYNEVMKVAAKNMLDSAMEVAGKADQQFKSASLTYDQKKNLTVYMNDANQKIDKAKKARSEGNYYVSASLAFQSKTNATYVLFSLEFYDSQKKATVRQLIESIEEEVEKTLDAVNGTSFTSITAFECYAAGEKRANEAYRGVETAWELFYGNNISLALWQAAYVKQRAVSAIWWASLCKQFPGDVEVNRTVLRSTAQEHIADLKYILVYAQSVGQTVDTSLFVAATHILDEVVREFDDGAYAAAILESLRSRSYLNAYLELGPSLASGSTERLVDTLSEKVERERELAHDAIARSREFGVNPILALSHMEFGESYLDDIDLNNLTESGIGSLFQAIFELKYARLVAEMSPIISQRLGIKGMEDAPIIEPFEGRTVYKTRVEDAVAIAGSFFAIGLVVGVLAGRRRRQDGKYGI